MRRRKFCFKSLRHPKSFHNDLPDSTNDKTFASGPGGMGFKSRTEQISHKLPTTRRRYNLDQRLPVLKYLQRYQGRANRSKGSLLTHPLITEAS